MTNVMTRRNLLRSTALIPIAFLPGCGTATAIFGGTATTAQIQQAGADVRLIDQGLVALETFAGSVLGMSSPTIARYADYLNKAGAIATAIIAAGGGATGTQVQQWETYINAAVGALQQGLSGLNSTNPTVQKIVMVLGAAAALLPTIEVAFNILAPVVVPGMAARHFAAMSPADARKELASVL